MRPISEFLDVILPPLVVLVFLGLNVRDPVQLLGELVNSSIPRIHKSLDHQLIVPPPTVLTREGLPL